MSRLSESETDGDDTPERPSFGTGKRALGDSTGHSDSSQDEGSSRNIRPAKRQRADTLGTSSQSSGVSENLSQPESDNEIPSEPSAAISSIAERIMKKTGFVEGKGLGKFSQGRVDPIEASKQRGRMGLGFQSFSKGKKYTGAPYDPSKDTASAEEHPIWMGESPNDPLDRDILDNWLEMGPKKMTIHDEDKFCNPQILEDVLSLKTELDSINSEDLRRIRSTCNPFEKIGKVFFVNRAALKMANIDTVFGNMFTNPQIQEGNKKVPMVGPNELLYFADVCAGPGGFTEYVLWKKKWHSKGFGFTLKGSNDFTLSELYAASTDTFIPYYGEANDGDIFNPLNLASLKKFVLANTGDKGVHFLMADGGFAVEGQENIQEILSKQLYLCQCIAALSIVRAGGNFVVKLFDVFTKFSVGLIYLMYRSFRRICLHKPNTSRPANSERYLICEGKRDTSDTIERHLIQVNEILWKSKLRKDHDVCGLVPIEVMEKDRNFFNYIVESNDRMGETQIQQLKKIILFNANPKLHPETRHTQMKNECLKLWDIPQVPRIVPKTGTDKMESVFKLMVKDWRDLEMDVLIRAMNAQPKQLTTKNDFVTKDGHSLVDAVYDWRFIFLNNTVNNNSDKFAFYLGCAGSVAFKFNGKTWLRYGDLKLPADTLLLAEMVQENRGEGRGMFKYYALHILDAFCLGGVCVFNEPLEERYKKIALFCTAMDKPHDPSRERNFLSLRCKKLMYLEDLQSEMDHLVKRKLKNSSQQLPTAPVPNVHDNSDLYYAVNSVLLMKFLKKPWTMNVSRSSHKKYYWNIKTKETTYELVKESVLNTFDALTSRLEWPLYNPHLSQELLLDILARKKW